jgi:cytochrome c
MILKTHNNLFTKSLILLFTVLACTDPGPEYTSMPEESRFSKITLVEKLDEPMELEVLSDGRVLFIERKGKLKLYRPSTGETEEIGFLDVYAENEDGLLGMAVDPDFDNNQWIYLYYAPIGNDSINRLSRFELVNERLDPSSEKIMLEIPHFRGCCHSGGSLEFGKDGNLFLSLGDDTNPFGSDNYNPIDERQGRAEAWDAQRSAANSNDLRGSILRIKPEANGTYSIPKGNLFPPGTPDTRPEIYVMGNRNPFRISVDPKNGFLYWGEVGPDASKDSLGRGPKGHDEVNQARGPGFFGWPYFVGDNKAYWYYDFENQESHEPFEVQAPINNSPNNTGVKKLPPAQKAFIWYPYDASEEFPMVGEGGRNAMAGPVFYNDLYKNSEVKFPDYFDRKLIIYDWMRNWIMLVSMDENHAYDSMERFMPSTQFDKPIDMQFGKDGALYILEYGTYWNSQNDDAGLYKIEFSRGNRKPVAKASADKTRGAAPLTVSFSSKGSYDADGDSLRYEWTFDKSGVVQSATAHPQFTFDGPGIYQPTLKVIDQEGKEDLLSLIIEVGNEPPVITMDIKGNSSFYWGHEDLLYTIHVEDNEDGNTRDGSIRQEDVTVTFGYLAEGQDMILEAQGHQTASAVLSGKELMTQSDCMACHAMENASVGPTYLEIATRYHSQEGAGNKLVEKIVLGGGGNWGERVMPAHPQLSRLEAGKMVDYILSLGNKAEQKVSIPLKGRIMLDAQKNLSSIGRYTLIASYKDKGGNGINPITSRKEIVLRNALVLAASADAFEGTAKANNQGSRLVKLTEDRAYIRFNDVDLTDIKYLVYSVDPAKTSGKIEMRLQSPEGKLIGSTAELSRKKMGATDGSERWLDTKVTIEHTEGRHDIFFVFRGGNEVNIWNSFLLNSIYFGK